MANNDYITTDCKLTVSKNTAKLDEEIFLYKNDRNIKLLIEIVDNKYRYKSDDLSNLLVKYKASYAQVKWYKNAEVKKEFPIQATDDGKVVFVIEGQLIDEDTELGDYDLQLRLLNESQESIRSLPIIKGAVHILKPLFEEGDIATVNSAVADVSMLSLGGDAIDTYNSDGTYNQTNWGSGDIISSSKLNKLEKVAKDNVDKVNKMPAKSIVEGGKIYLAKEDGTKLDSGTELPAGGTGTSYDDTEIKTDINTIKTDLGTAQLTTTAKDVKGAVNEVAAQYKDIVNKIENINPDLAKNDLFLKLLNKLGYTLSDLIEKLPVVKIAGDLTGISADNYKNVTCNFNDELNNINFTDYATIAYQGSGSLAYPKKNYKIKLFTDETRTIKNIRQFKDWHKTNNYHLKCNFVDATNIMNNLMMHYVTKSYQYLSPLPRAEARYTVDGFPVLLYVNNDFVGIYFWNLKQDDKVYKLNEEIVGEDGSVTQQADLCYQIGLNNGSNQGDNSGAFIYGNLNSGSNAGKNFTNAHAEIDYYWEDRVWDKVANHPDVLYSTIQWVSDASDEEFKASLENYFDKEYLINYFVIMYTCAMIDSKAKNFNMLYFPDKRKWYPTFWDMDFAFGTTYTVGKSSTDIELNSFGCKTSRLFDKLWENFKPDIVAKYKELRKTLFTTEQVEDSINHILGNISATWLAKNYEVKYNGTNFNGKQITDPKTYILNWAKARFTYMDTVMNYIPDTPEVDAEKLYYELGDINYQAGEETESTTKVRTNYIPVNAISVTINSDVNNNTITHAVRCYDENYNYLGTGSSTTFSVQSTQTLKTNTKYLKLILNSTTTINDGDLNNLLITVDGKSYKLSKDTVTCTNITLNSSTLNFATTDSQILKAILTPYNTTDKVIWSVSPTGICVVDKGVVIPLKDGNCIVTATCGVQTATCNVTVAGMPNYTMGYINDNGDIVPTKTDALSNQIIEKQGTITINVSTEAANSIENLRLAEFDENMKFIKRSYAKNYVNYALDANTRYVRIGFAVNNGVTDYTSIFKGITIS